MKEPTICMDCEHHEERKRPITTGWTTADGEWHTDDILHICKVTPDEKIDYVTGKVTKKYQSCYDVNPQGTCPYFKERELQYSTAEATS